MTDTTVLERWQKPQRPQGSLWDAHNGLVKAHNSAVEVSRERMWEQFELRDAEIDRLTHRLDLACSRIDELIYTLLFAGIADGSWLSDLLNWDYSDGQYPDDPTDKGET
jgi:hypothetical protein